MLKINKLMLVLILMILFLPTFNQSIAISISESSEDMKYKIFDMPFEFAGTESHTGPATLAMLFQHYGCLINQEDFINISSTNAPGVRGTPIEGYIQALNYDNYTNKKFGYEAQVVNLENYTSEARWEFLKDFVDEEIPILLLTRCCISTNYYIAYRLLTGYDERTKSIYCQDPYRGYDASSGPLSDFSFAEFEHRWSNIGYQLIIPKIMEIKLEIETQPIDLNTPFTLKSFINCDTLPEIPENLSLELSLPTGYSQQGNPVSTLLTNGSSQISYDWTIMSPENLSLEDNITLKVNYLKENITYGNLATIYPVEPKKPVISRLEGYSSLIDDYVPITFDVRSEVDYSSNIPYDIKIDSYNYSELTIYPTYQYYSINFAMNQTEVSGTFSEFEQNETIVFCWVTLNISQTRNFKSPISVFIVNTDLDSNKFRLSSSTSLFGLEGVILTLMGQLLCFKFLSRKKKK